LQHFLMHIQLCLHSTIEQLTRRSIKQCDGGTASAQFISTSATPLKSPASVSSSLSLTFPDDDKQANGFFRFCAFLPGGHISRDERLLGGVSVLVVGEFAHRLLRRRSFMTSAGFFHSGDVCAIMKAISAVHTKHTKLQSLCSVTQLSRQSAL